MACSFKPVKAKVKSDLADYADLSAWRSRGLTTTLVKWKCKEQYYLTPIRTLSWSHIRQTWSSSWVPLTSVQLAHGEGKHHKGGDSVFYSHVTMVTNWLPSPINTDTDSQYGQREREALWPIYQPPLAAFFLLSDLHCLNLAVQNVFIAL